MTTRLARGRAWAIRTWWRVPPARRKTVSRAIRYLGLSLNAMAISGEVLMMLPLAVLALAFIDAAVGSGWGLLLVASVWVKISRPSARATLWLVGGLFLAANLLGLGHEVVRVGGVLDGWRTALVWSLTALALAVGGGVVVLPLVRLGRTQAPSLCAIIGGWLISTMKGALAGAAAGSLLLGLFPAGGPLSEDQSGGRLLIPVVATALGILCGWCARLWNQDRDTSTSTFRANKQ